MLYLYYVSCVALCECVSASVWCSAVLEHFVCGMFWCFMHLYWWLYACAVHTWRLKHVEQYIIKQVSSSWSTFIQTEAPVYSRLVFILTQFSNLKLKISLTGKWLHSNACYSLRKKNSFLSSRWWTKGRFYDPFKSKGTTDPAAQRYVACLSLTHTRTHLHRYTTGHWVIIPATEYRANAHCGRSFCEHLQWSCLDLNYNSLNFESYCQWSEKNGSTTIKGHPIY